MVFLLSFYRPWFWKLIQHIDRVDSILATHLGSDNLPGLNSLLLRKLQERQVKLPMDNTTPEYKVFTDDIFFHANNAFMFSLLFLISLQFFGCFMKRL